MTAPSDSQSENRSRRIARIRRQIENGEYETLEKLSIAVERLLESLQDNHILPDDENIWLKIPKDS